MNSKFQNEIKELRENNIISDAVASDIYDYYQSKSDTNPNKLLTIFGVLGSTLVGLGIILIVAHNWDNFSRSIKTVFAFLPLIIGQTLALFSIVKNKSNAWKESSGAFLFFAVGSSISLVSQIYNIPGNISSFMLVWLLLCMPVIYILKSKALLLLHIVFMTYYAISYGFSFYNNKTPWLYLVLLIGILPFYFNLLKKERSTNITSIFNWLIPISVTMVLATFLDNGHMWFLIYIFLFSIFYAIGKLPYFENQRLRRNGYVIIGSLGSIYVLLFTTFKWIWRDLRNVRFETQELSVAVILFFTALAIFLINKFKYKRKSFNGFEYIFLAFGLIFLVGSYSTLIAIVLTNILVFALGLQAVKLGVDKMHFGILNYGLVIVTALIVCRFFDTEMSFVIRGLLFVVVGVGFFITNYIMYKKQNSKKLNS